MVSYTKLHRGSLDTVNGKLLPIDKTDLVGYWPFWENAGTTLYEESKHENDGAINGATWEWDANFSKPALFFDGVDDYVEIGNLSIYNFASDDKFSYSIWFRPEDYTNVGNGYIWVQHERSYFMQRDTNNMELTCNIGGAGTSFGIIPATGEWHHAAFTYDAGTLTLYFDGSQVNQASVTSDDMSTSTMYFGTYDTTAYFADGKMDEVRIYDRALTENEITNIYEKTKP